MKKLLLSLIQTFFVLSVFAQLRATSNLNLRECASTSCKVLATIPQGTQFNIQGSNSYLSEWIAINYNGSSGYVLSSYLKPYSSSNTTSGIKYYTNSEGHRIQSPTNYNSQPAGATALCRDGTYSFSQNHRGTCSHHGGVARWLD